MRALLSEIDGQPCHADMHMPGVSSETTTAWGVGVKTPASALSLQPQLDVLVQCVGVSIVTLGLDSQCSCRILLLVVPQSITITCILSFK